MLSFFPDLTCGARVTALVVAATLATAVPQANAAAVSGQGTWETTLQGRDLDGNAANGFEAFYDTALNITWLADANYAQTSGYTSEANGGIGPSSPIFSTIPKWIDGRMGWQIASNWVNNLNAYGTAGWRLPTMIDTGQLGCDSAYSGTDCLYNVSTTSSELAHLFHVTLGNKSYLGPSGDFQPDFGLANSGPFKNVKSDLYWFGVEYMPGGLGFGFNEAWYFDTKYGRQSSISKLFGIYAWAVRSGDIAAVPELQTYALMSFGLAALALACRLRQD